MADHPLVRSDFYVYVLFRENGSPFYIGKGCGRRWFSHEAEAKKLAITPKLAIIRKMLSNNLDIPKIKVHENLDAETALAYEVALIAAVGRFPYGPLVNQTQGGD